jgi:hypothetical protein
VPLVVDHLQLWTVGFRLAGLDPHRLWWRLPATAKDWFSTLLDAILSDHLNCITLNMQKWDGTDRELAPFYIRYWLDEINLGIHRQQFSRKLLKHAVIDRLDFKDWCERRSIPLPEFWFPPGWTEYRYPGEDQGGDGAPGSAPVDGAVPAADAQRVEASATADSPMTEPPLSGGEIVNRVRPSQKARIACQVIAASIWRMEPDRTIASMCKDERLKLGDAAFYDEVTVKRWIQQVAPPHVSARRGRPKKNPPEGS